MEVKCPNCGFSNVEGKQFCRVCDSRLVPCLKTNYIKFEDRHGNTVELRGDLTLEDLRRMGWESVSLVAPEKGIPEGVWRAL